MTTYTQDGRRIAVETPLGKDKLLLNSFSGEEGISQLFSFELRMAADKEDDVIDPEKILGKQIDFFVKQPDDEPRYFNGYVSEFRYGGTSERLHSYSATVVPWLWMLTKASDCRVFEVDESADAKQIVDEVFADFGFSDYEWKVNRDLENREFCVQYNESSFDFVSRLLEYEGICYFFKHEKGKHTLVLADNKDAFTDCPNDNSLSVSNDMQQFGQVDKITKWQHGYSFTTGNWTLSDNNFTDSSGDLESTKKTVVKTPGVSKYEHYEFPGNHLVKSYGDALAVARIEAEEAKYDTVTGSSICRDFSPGFNFRLDSHTSESEAHSRWTLTRVIHNAQIGGDYISGGGGAGSGVYENQFECIPADVQFRPTRTTPKPKVNGILTAVVVGPGGEEIHTDEHGRIKIQFLWDRLGSKDDTSSFWVRVSFPWTGEGWGMMSIPRVGQEVIVDFINGDPDRPIVTGMVYNDQTTPPWTLPDNKTQSGIKTQSTPSGGSSNYNELRFEDKTGSEEVYLQAEKDLNAVVKNDETRIVGQDGGSGNQTINILKDRTLTVETGNDEVAVDKGNRDIKIKMGDQTTKADMGNITSEAMQSIELKVGSNSIKIDQSGITIKGITVTIDGSANATVKGGIMTTVEAGGMLTVKGGITMIN